MGSPVSSMLAVGAFLALALGASAGASAAASNETPEGSDLDLSQKASLVRVVDGDTIQVRRRGRVHDVRLIGIDTPEVFGAEECGGRQASRPLAEMVSRRDKLVLRVDPSQDRRDGFGRLLRYVTLEGFDVGRAQLRRGWANVFVFERPFARLGGYRDSRNGARENDRGIWGRCDGKVHQPL